MKRRTVLASAAAGSAAFGLAAATGTFAREVAAHLTAPDGSAPIVAYVSDARTGEVVVMVGTTEIVRRDAGLVARLVAIAKEASDVVAS